MCTKDVGNQGFDGPFGCLTKFGCVAGVRCVAQLPEAAAAAVRRLWAVGAVEAVQVQTTLVSGTVFTQARGLDQPSCIHPQRD